MMRDEKHINTYTLFQVNEPPEREHGEDVMARAHRDPAMTPASPTMWVAQWCV